MTTDSRLDFRFGDTALLESCDAVGLRSRVHVLGGLPGKSLLLTAPEGKSAVVPVAGTEFEVRIFSGDGAQCFRSRLIRSSTEPYPHLHLDFPDHVERAPVRNTPRARMSLPATVQVVSNPDFELADRSRLSGSLPATICDLGTGGAKLESAHDLGAAGTRLAIMTTFKFEQAATHAVVLPAEIRYARAGTGEVTYAYGVQFFDLDVAADHALSAFVYRHLVSQLLRDPA